MTPYVPNCAVPLLFESEYEEAPYGTAGTGFLMQWENGLFFTTAGHCLKPGDHNRLRVPADYHSSQVLQLREFGRTSLPGHEHDTDHADFGLFSVEPVDFGPRDEKNLEPAVLPQTDTAMLLKAEIPLTVRGHPRAAPLAGIDYERGVVGVQALTCDAKFLGPAESKFCYTVQFVDSCPITDFNHMSGSPVFAKCKHEGRPLYILVGLLLRAGGPSRFGRFVSIECVKEGLRRFAAQNVPNA